MKPERIVADYERIRQADPSRPVLLNLGQGVANDEWKGRGPGASLDDYPKYVRGGDIISFDVYPVVGLDRRDGSDLLWYVAKGVGRLVKWTEGRKIVWNCIECTHIGNAQAKATPHQVKAEVWMALVHGSTGLIYFVHEFAPRFKEAALLDDPEMLAAVTAINRQIRELAPVLNSPTVDDGAIVASSANEVPIDVMVKRHDGATYVFAVGMRNAPRAGPSRSVACPKRPRRRSSARVVRSTSTRAGSRTTSPPSTFISTRSRPASPESVRSEALRNAPRASPRSPLAASRSRIDPRQSPSPVL